MTNLTKFLLCFIGGTVLLYLGFYAPLFPRHAPDIEAIQRDFSFALQQKSDKAEYAANLLFQQLDEQSGEEVMLRQSEWFAELAGQQGIALYAAKDNKIILWSDNSVSSYVAFQQVRTGYQVHHFNNGWYASLQFSSRTGYEIIALILLKYEYPYQNKYLSNSFAPAFRFAHLEDITLEPHTQAVPISYHNDVFYLKINPEPTGKFSAASAILGFAGLALLLAAIAFLAISIKQKFASLPAIVFSGLLLLLLRFLLLHFSWPAGFEQFSFFSPLLYASSAWAPSLADLLVNVVFVLFWLLLIRFHLQENLKTTTSRYSSITAVILLGLAFFYSIGISEIIISLVEDSSINLEIYNLSQLSVFSLSALLIGILWYFSFFLAADAILGYLTTATNISRKLYWVIFSVLCLGYVIILFFWNSPQFVLLLWPVPVVALQSYVRLYGMRVYQVNTVILLIILFSLSFSQLLLKYTALADINHRLAYSERLAVNNDPVAEILFRDLKEDMKGDDALRRVFLENELHNLESLENFIGQRYFNGYWSRYNVNVYAYNADSSYWGRPDFYRTPSLEELYQKIRQYGYKTSLNEEMYHLYNTPDQSVYLMVLPVHYGPRGRFSGYLAFELFPRLFPDQIGFPELLIDETAAAAGEPAKYATARYVNGKLTHSRGDYPYAAASTLIKQSKLPLIQVRRNGYNHLIRRVDNHTYVVVSEAVRTRFDEITTLSYLCALFAMIFLIAALVRHFTYRNSVFSYSLSVKIQLLLVSFIVISLLLFTLATRNSIEKQYRTKNTTLLTEKTQSVAIALAARLGEEEALDPSMESYMTRLLTQFSYTFFTDINLYSVNGNLMATSQPGVYRAGLISRKIDPEAFAHLKVARATVYSHQENVGALTYLSAYRPFYNDRGELLAYLNLPYFSRQSELEQEVSQFMVAVANIFVLLIILSIITALFVTSWITEPLRNLRESLANIELGKATKIVAHRGHDEISDLIAEYNAKVTELEHNADALARSERESAWRDMAKQVAHEIKNPLTPMKLSVQHLQRVFEQQASPDREKINRVAETLIEQIDSLASIASAFSHFAKMPHARREKVDLVQVIRSAMDLFDTYSDIRISFDANLSDAVYVLGDKDQLLRVFNNLIKNAIQAIPNTRKGQISIEISLQQNHVLCSVTDNGSGIDPEKQEKIFVPNFTTKTRGMGLGLAMVKSITEETGGKVWFTTTPGVGTTFFVQLPLLQN